MFEKSFPSNPSIRMLESRAKRSLSIAAAMFLCLGLVFVSIAAPNESGYTQFTPQNSFVPADYVWRINFSGDVDINSAYSGISMYEVDGTGNLSEFEISPQLGTDDESAIEIFHGSEFDEGSSYKLFIDGSVKSQSGKNLSTPVFMEFSSYSQNPGDFSAIPSPDLEVISDDDSSLASAANSAYTYIQVAFNRQLHSDTTSLEGGILEEPGGITSYGMPQNIYANGKLSDASVVWLEWDESSPQTKLYMMLRGAGDIDEGDTVKFTFKSGVIKDVSGEYLPSSALSCTIYGVHTPVGTKMLKAESIYDGSIKNCPTNENNGHLQIYFPSGTDLRPVIAMDKDLVMTKSDGTKQIAKLHIDNNGITTYGIYKILDINIDIPFEIGDEYTFSGLHGTDLGGIKLVVNELH